MRRWLRPIWTCCEMRRSVAVLSCALPLVGLSSCAHRAPNPAARTSVTFPPLDSGGKWAPILSSPNTSYDVSLDGVERPTPTTVTLWVKSEFKGNNNLLAVGFGNSVTREEFDCKRKRMRTLASAMYDRGGDSISSRLPFHTPWFTPRRGSDYAFLLSEVCAQLVKAP